jgi:hypothetical protein
MPSAYHKKPLILVGHYKNANDSIYDKRLIWMMRLDLPKGQEQTIYSKCVYADIKVLKTAST